MARGQARLRKEKEKKKKGKKRAPAKIRGAFGEGTAEVAKEKGALHVAQQLKLGHKIVQQYFELKSI